MTPSAHGSKPAGEEQVPFRAPSIAAPKGGGAIRGIGEKFAANPVTGTGSMSVPIALTPGRSGFGPQLALTYDSGTGNGPFGFGWSLSIPSISRKTDKGLPKFCDVEESDVFVYSGAEDLVPVLELDQGARVRRHRDSPAAEVGFVVDRYRPRIEGAFIRIERWTERLTGIAHWRTISRDNVTTLYGRRDDARIADPAHPERIFSWLACESFDAKGNAILYAYKAEDAASVDAAEPCESVRVLRNRFAQRYLKHVRYGNRTPRQPAEDLSLRDDWLFEAVLDYGEHDTARPTVTEVRPWPVRKDPFSRFRATFDVRTYRLCRRVLMFHHLPDELGGSRDCLVRSTDLSYDESEIASFVDSITQAGYVLKKDDTYSRKNFPTLAFGYTKATVDETVHEIDDESIRNLPYGVDGARFQWVDLDSEGLTGVLVEQADAWWYKRNLGNGTFGPSERIAPRPLPTALSGGQQLVDLAGEGRLDLVQWDGPMAGYYHRDADGGWQPFRRFKAMPNLDSRNPNLRFVDVTGDGHPDLLISEDAVFTWYESRTKDGFASAARASKPWNEEDGPTVVFAEATQSIFLSDMTGDGLSDIVRVRHDGVCYWPNLGYGRFGAKVVMGNAPVFDRPELFDARRVHFADIDGSGCTDIVYVGVDGVSLHFNQSGNTWAAPRRLSHFPAMDSLKSVAVTDLLGNGTACLVWSSRAPADARHPMRYIDLMGGHKPHLLVQVENNMGARTNVSYVPSTQWYLQDRIEGRPWITRLPFPVHVIDRVETRDLVSDTKLVSTYRYRHGYFDGVEREFHGFAQVEQRDAESVGGAFDLPPIVTKTWFHTGAFFEDDRIESLFRDPAANEYFTGDPAAVFLPDTSLPPDLDVDEMREATRALKGCLLRQEVYADDGSAEAGLPYSVSDRNYRLVTLQRREQNRHAVFFVHPCETIDYHCERNVGDPRISHTVTLDVDNYGNVLKSVAIAYARRVPAFDEQKQVLATLTESDFTNAVDAPNACRTPLPSDVRTYALTATVLKGAKPLALDTIASMATTAVEIAYELAPTPGLTEKRLIERARTVYRKDDLSALLAVGKLESMALPGESYKMALTPGLLDVFQARATRAELNAILTGAEGQYRMLDGNGVYWIPSSRVFYSPTPHDAPQQELPFARAHFFLPHRFQDPFGNETILAYDTKYALLPIQVRDAVGNETTADYDYRVLQPRLVTDPNGNRIESRFDALGMLAGRAVRGKATGVAEGDSFDDFDEDLDDTVVAAFFSAADPRALAVTHLGSATTRVLYDLRHVPPCATSIARETHVSALSPGQTSKVQLRFSYSDGFGREAQTRLQAEPGPLDPNNPASPVLNSRWIASGAKVFNNKGKPVRQYEPFFSATPHFGIETHGVASTLFYDPIERIVATLRPDHTFEKTVFSPWHQTTWDVNDTVTFDPKADPDIGRFCKRLPDADYLPTWFDQRKTGALGASEKAAADKTAQHADTPTVVHADTLGRSFLTVVDNGNDAGGNAQKYATRLVLDIEGNQREVIDALDRVVMRYDYDLLGTRIHQSSMEAGRRWMLNDAMGQPMRGWDSRQHATRTEYDALHRRLRSFMRGGDPSEANSKTFSQEIVFEQIIYGDSADTGLIDLQRRQANLRGKLFRHFDAAGIATTDKYDFKGNPLRGSRQFAADYKSTPDWSKSPLLEAEKFSSSTLYDALNRAIAVTTPDNSVYRPTFNEANLLKKVDVNLRAAQKNGQPAWTPFVTNINYDAKGQRTFIHYANGVQTTYVHNDKTFRLTHLKTTRSIPPVAPAAGPTDVTSQIFNSATTVQGLRYTYDPMGNITRIEDAALQTVHHDNQQIDPASTYTYDALYRLIAATGREHIGQSAFQFVPANGSYRDYPFVGAAQTNDLQALRNYTELYDYDPVGNFNRVIHQAVKGNWTRAYTYAEPSQNESTRKSNRLSQTAFLASPGSPVEPYRYDAHGNMTQMPHLPSVGWDFKDRLSASSRQVLKVGTSETTFYVYNADGQRVRKVTERQNGTRKNEQLYLGGSEIYREYGGGGTTVTQTRETLHVMDDKQRVAIVETKTIDNGASIAAPLSMRRYQLGNHRGSVSLELDNAGALISYEEYSPYGSPAYQAARSAAEVSLKRFRYTGKERDEETGFGHHGARYFASWLGRWTNCDPAHLADGLNLYQYVSGNPVMLDDPTGRAGESEGLVPAYRLVRWVVQEGSKAWKTPPEIAKRISALAELSGVEEALHVGHPSDSPRVLTPAGREVIVRLQTKESNLKESGQDRVAATAVRKGEASGVHNEADPGFVRDTRGRDPNPPAGAPSRPKLVRTVGKGGDAASLSAEAPGAASAESQGGAAGASAESGASAKAPVAEAVKKTEGTAAKAKSFRSAARGEQGGFIEVPSSSTVVKALKFAGKVATVYGAHKEAQRSAAQVEGEFNKNAAYSTTFALGVAGGVIDDALAVMPSTSGFVNDSWEHHNAGPTQVLAGDTLRAFNSWVMRNSSWLP
jgi:RHS repeat-associated protein